MTKVTEANIKALIAPVAGFGELPARQRIQQGQGREVAKFLTAVDMAISA